ncbi:hypothetical protein RBA41_21135 [Massilia sp. CCM 9210]|uniref:hypothetical protein n=1 Tax=Massilia scottii TaxID=3057166 RepID=UPI0027965D2D|nr:hypothetical protein [Massilia sp. CCM 9210]MDQ1815804.1 hypothetical protein [Massilia sp. CCM 9210]
MLQSKLPLMVSCLSLLALGACNNSAKDDGNSGTKSAIDTFEYKHDPDKYKDRPANVNAPSAGAESVAGENRAKNDGNSGTKSAIDTFEYKHDPNKYKNPPVGVNGAPAKAQAVDSATGVPSNSVKE